MKCLHLILGVLFAATTSAQQQFDIIITEIMADPSPAVGLPNSEWVEIKNQSHSPVNLQGWRLGDRNSLTGPLPNFTLLPDSFLVICSQAAFPLLSAISTALPVSAFPSLDNEGDLVFLRSSSLKTIHAIEFLADWHQNELKKDGGWSLEMIDPTQPCIQAENWKSSTSSSGGTPGKKNSVTGTINDEDPPRLIKAWPPGNTAIILEFNEPVDSFSAANAGNYSINGLSVSAAKPVPPLFDAVELWLSPALLPGNIYDVLVSGVRDCQGNLVGQYDECRVGLPVDPLPGDWIINEILFNPVPNGYDYVECLNTSNKVFDASRLFLANRNSAGAIANIKALSSLPHLVFPGEHIVVTENGEHLGLRYFVKHPSLVIEVSSLPSFPDDEGFVLSLDGNGSVVDELHYNEDWHYKLITEPEGISLERIDPSALTNKPASWHSASFTSGYGTPTSKNSQSLDMSGSNATIEISPTIFSPDNDGYHDLAMIKYKLEEPGYTANVTVFDAWGRVVRKLPGNALLGTEGYLTWDGLNEIGGKLPAGLYIILSELFTLNGKKKVFKNRIVIAYRY
jgi:hypothetical protein